MTTSASAAPSTSAPTNTSSSPKSTPLNVANHPTLSHGVTTAWGAPGTATGNAFGTITGAQANPRDFQFAGRFTF